MHIFTSITANYLPKAAALAHSVKRVHPEAKFHVVLSDTMADCPAATTAAFDSIINIQELPIANLPSWIFKHRLVELCTAVKGTAFQYIADQFGAERIYYFDPDILVCNRLDGLNRILDRHSVLLTPHQCHPETDPLAISDNEHCCMRNGVFNLGFLAVRMTTQGREFIDWWAERLRCSCYDEVHNGLFTDQRWVDLAPAYFDDIAIVRDPEFNVATWNLTQRRATGHAPYEIQINGRPLVFYHFSGFDSGAQKMMLERYGAHSPVLFDLREWYVARCEEFGQSTIGKTDCLYNVFSNGQPVTSAHRILYRRSDELIQEYPVPFDADDPLRSYYHWYRANVPKSAEDLLMGPHKAPHHVFELIRAHAAEPAVKRPRLSWASALRRRSQSV